MLKHVPEGLYPFFDSGFERKPFYVENGEKTVIGCRLDDEASERLTLEVEYDNKDRIRISSIPERTDDLGRKYYKFEITIDEDAKTGSYNFILDNEDESKKYFLPIVKNYFLEPEKIIELNDSVKVYYIFNNRNIILKIDHKTSRIEISEFYDEVPEGEKGTAEWVDITGNGSAYVSSKLNLLAGNGKIYRIMPEFKFKGKRFYGFGEKFNSVDQAGYTHLNHIVEKFSDQGEYTYFPIPMFYSDSGTGLFQNGTYISSFDLSEKNIDGFQRVKIDSDCPDSGCFFKADILVGDPEDILKKYAQTTGSPALPPKWAFGPWISANGWNTQREAAEQIEKSEKLGIPVSAMVLEAWSDEETFYIFNDARYEPRKDGSPFIYEDFTFDTDGKWPDPKAFGKYLAQKDVKLILWQIPAIKHERSPKGKQLEADMDHAIKNGLCIKNEDGTPYRVTDNWFANSLVPDFSNRATRKWWMEKRRYLIEDIGVSGFKTDGGEFLFDMSAKLSDSREVREAHNDYPNMYHDTYNEFMNEKTEGVLLSRAGFSGNQKNPIHWAGDQISDFSEFKSQLTAGLSLGLSGVPFWGFDIGGFAGVLPSKQLYLRSAAMAAFCPLMQFHSEPRSGQYYETKQKHSNNDRSPWNLAEAAGDEDILEIYRMFANLRMNFIPYIWQEAKFCAETSRPLMAHLIYDFLETDDAVSDIHDQYMFGRDLLIAPVLEDGTNFRKVYLPKGQWSDLWTGNSFIGGRYINIETPLEKIGVFVKKGSVIPVNINEQMIMGTKDISGRMPNDTDKTINLCLLAYGTESRVGGLYQDKTVKAVFYMDRPGLPGNADTCEAEIFGRKIRGRIIG